MTCKKGDWSHNNIPTIARFPEEAQRGQIVFSDGSVMGILNNNPADGTKVVAQRSDPAATGQIWIRQG